MGCGLRRYVEDLLSLVDGNWKLEFRKSHFHYLRSYVYEIASYSRHYRDVVVKGYGVTKEAALKGLISAWRQNRTSQLFPMPARSKDELKVKLDLRRLNEDESRRKRRHKKRK